MKTRRGFVSNSSSSSFVIALARKPQTIMATQELLFDEDQIQYGHPYTDESFEAAHEIFLIGEY